MLTAMSVGTANRIRIARIPNWPNRPPDAVRCFRVMPSRATAEPRRGAMRLAGTGWPPERRAVTAAHREVELAAQRDLLPAVVAAGRSSRALLAAMSRRRARKSPAISAGHRSGMDLHASLIALMPAPFDPTSRGKSFQHVAHRRSLHSKANGQLRGGNPGFLTDTCQRAMHRNGRIGHALELSIERAHAIDE